MRENHTSILGNHGKAWSRYQSYLELYPGFKMSSLEDVQALASHLANGTSLEELRVHDALQTRFSSAFLCVNGGRRLFRTAKKLLGLCPQSARVRDSVWILHDTIIPFVLRPVPGSESFQLVGESYVHGFMHGELVDSGKAELREIMLT